MIGPVPGGTATGIVSVGADTMPVEVAGPGPTTGRVVGATLDAVAVDWSAPVAGTLLGETGRVGVIRVVRGDTGAVAADVEPDVSAPVSPADCTGALVHPASASSAAASATRRVTLSGVPS